MKKYISLLICILALFTSCEDVIEMDVKKGKDALVVEGWITDQPDGNFVKLYLTVPYFDNPKYSPIRNARVRITDDLGNVDSLRETEPGKYVVRSRQRQVGRTYKLFIEATVGRYEAVARMQRLSWTLDSVTYQYKGKGTMVNKAGFYPSLHGQEQKGSGDFIRLKIFRNGQLLDSPSEINLFDDRFVDGNYIHSAKPMVKEGFQKTDRLRYELWSLTDDAYRFWDDLKTQLNNGGLFAAPGNNTRTNLVKTDPNSMDVTGYFGASEVKVFENTVGE